MFKFKPQVSKILSQEQIDDLREMPAPYVRSHAAYGSRESTYVDIVKNGDDLEKYPDIIHHVLNIPFRRSKNKVITSEMVDDINFEFEHLWADAGLKVTDTNYVRYDVGDYIARHRDNADYEGNGTHIDRKIAGITMVDKSDDLEGGILIVYQDQERYEFDLEIGETVFFMGTCIHECTEITRGYREVLVSWMS